MLKRKSRARKDPDAVQSPEFKAFEEGMKAILKVPKSAIDKKLAAQRKPKPA